MPRSPVWYHPSLSSVASVASSFYLAGLMLRIAAVDAHFHARCSLAAGTLFEFIPRCVADNGRAFRSAVADGVVETDAFEEDFDVLVHGGSADDDLVEIVAKGFLHLAAYVQLHAVAKQGRHQGQPDGGSLDLREDSLAHDLLDEQGNGDDHLGLQLREGFQQHRGRGRLAQERHVGTACHLVEELEGHAVHVCRRQDAHDVVAFLDVVVIHFVGKFHVAPQGAIGYHDALRVRCRAARVVEHSHLLGVIDIVIEVAGAEVHRETFAEQTVEVLARVPYFIRTCVKNTILIARVGKDTFQSGHLLHIELRPHLVADEQQLGIGVVHDVVDLFGVELV